MYVYCMYLYVGNVRRRQMPVAKPIGIDPGYRRRQHRHRGWTACWSNTTRFRPPSTLRCLDDCGLPCCGCGYDLSMNICRNNFQILTSNSSMINRGQLLRMVHQFLEHCFRVLPKVQTRLCSLMSPLPTTEGGYVYLSR